MSNLRGDLFDHPSRRDLRGGARMSSSPQRSTRTTRIGDRERELAAERLSAHAAAGRLTVDELESRLERVNVAVYDRDLAAVEADLPVASRPRRPQRAPLALALLVAAVL